MRSKMFFVTTATAVVLMITAAVAISAVTAGNTGWKWSNPLPQGNSLNTLDMIGSRGYAGGAGGTLLRTDDAGATWGSVRTGILDDLRMVRAIGPDSVVFAGRCALRRSDDGGQTVKRLLWTANEESCDPQIRSFHFPTTDVGFLLLENGSVYYTADSGGSWTNKTALPGSPIVGGGDAPGDVWFTDASTGVASVGKNIYRTTDSGTSWTLVSNTATGALGRLSFVNANIGYVAGKGKNMLTTADGGATWTPVTVDAGTAGADLGGLDCANPNDCIAAAADGSQLFRTSNGGTSWSSVSPSSNGVFDVGYASAARVIAVGGGGATVVSDDNGATWSAVSGGIDGRFWGLRAQSPTTAFIFGANGALARTTDGGTSWTRLGVSTSGNVIGVGFPTATAGYVLDNNGVLLRTTNGGSSWQFLNTDGAQPRALAVPDATTVVLIGSKGVRRSTNSGDDFSKAAGKGLAKARLSELDHAGSALVTYNNRQIFVSTDRGKSWKLMKRPAKVSSISQIDMVNARAGYLLDSRGELWVTRTAGKKWKRVETTGTTFSESIAFGDISHGYLTDDTGRILYTEDAGASWSRQYPFYDANGVSSTIIEAPAAKTAFALVYDSARVFATTTGGTIGVPSSLTIKPSARKVKRNKTVRISGTLAGAQGGERVSVLARLVGAKGGARWVEQVAAVGANGRFTTPRAWKIKGATIFVARWSGDSAHDGDAARAQTVKLK